MNDPLALIQSAYAAFGRGDVPALLAMMDEGVDWRFIGDRGAPYTGHLKGRSQMAEFFGAVAAADDIQVFEPRQMLAGPDHVTVIGWERCACRNTGRVFESDWVHVWRVQDGRITQFLGLFDTQAAAQARSA